MRLVWLLLVLAACTEKKSPAPPPPAPLAASPVVVVKRPTCPPSLDLRHRLFGVGDASVLDLPLGDCTFRTIPSLHALNTDELRHGRNAVFARRGLRFKSRDLASFFARYSWYKPDADAVDDRLTDGDRENIAAFLAAEKRERARPPEGRFGIETDVHLTERNPGGCGGTFVFFEDGAATYEWKNGSDQEHVLRTTGRWILDWPHLIVSWTEASGKRGVGPAHNPLPGGGNGPDVYDQLEPFQHPLRTTMLIDWDETEKHLVADAARRRNHEPEELRSRVALGELTAAGVLSEASALDAEVEELSIGGVDCATVSCRLANGQPCTWCARSAGTACRSEAECLSEKCALGRCL